MLNRIVLLLLFISSFSNIGKAQDLAKKYYMKGVEFQQKAVYSRAIDYYTVALEKDAMYFNARYNRALVFFELKKYNKAIFDIRKLMETKTNDPELYSLLGLIHAKLHKPADAIHYIDQAISFKDDAIYHLRKADILIQNHQPELAFNELTVTSKDPQLEIATLELKARAYLNLHQTNQALLVYNKLIKRQPKTDYYFNRAILHKKNGNTVEACADFEEASQNLTIKEALQELIQCQWVKKDYNSILQTAKKGISNYPNEPIFYKYAGLAALKNGDNKLAIQWFDKALNLGASEIDIYINKGIALIPSNKEEAKKAFLLALKKDPTNTTAKHNLEVLDQSDY